MRTIIKVLYLILAFLFQFGSANIFNLDQYSTKLETDQGGILPIFFALCTIASLVDSKSRKNFYLLKLPAVFLFAFVLVLLFAEILFCGINVNLFYFVKLTIAIIGFIAMSLTFITYPKLLLKSLIIYSTTSLGIVLAFWGGLLEQSYYFSNGRLWFLGINPNTYSFMVGFAILIMIIICNKKQLSFHYKIIAFLSVLPLTIFLLLTGSRGSLMFLIFTLLIIYHKRLVLIFFAGVIAVFLYSNLITNLDYEITTFSRMTEIGQSNEREQLIEKTLYVYAQSPIVGVGPTGYKTTMLTNFSEERDSHNVLISNLALGGIMGLSLYLMFLFLLFRSVLKQSRYRIYALGIYVYMTLVSLKTGSVLTYSLMWYIYAISFTLNIIGRSKEQNIL